jgi:hypothetical protein
MTLQRRLFRFGMQVQLFARELANQLMKREPLWCYQSHQRLVKEMIDLEGRSV